jgi:transposase
MPWKENGSVFERRLKFVRLHFDGRYSITQLVGMFGVSCPTAYKWLKRYREEGVDVLRDRSKGPKTVLHRTDERTRPGPKATEHGIASRCVRGAPRASSCMPPCV